MRKILALLLSALGFFTGCDGPELMYGPVPPEHWTTPDDTMSVMYGPGYKTFVPDRQMDVIQSKDEASSEDTPFSDESK